MKTPPPPYEENTTHATNDTIAASRPALQLSEPPAMRSQRSHQTVASLSSEADIPEWTEEGPLFDYWPVGSWKGQTQNPADAATRSQQPYRQLPQDGLPHDGLALEVGDNVFKAHESRWTENWGWSLYWRLSANGPEDESPWGILVKLLSKTRPCLKSSMNTYFSYSNLEPLHGGVHRAKDGNLTRGWDWSRGYTFISQEKLPQNEREWMVEVQIRHRDRMQLESLNWQSLLTAETTFV